MKSALVTEVMFRDGSWQHVEVFRSASVESAKQYASSRTGVAVKTNLPGERWKAQGRHRTLYVWR